MIWLLILPTLPYFIFRLSSRHLYTTSCFTFTTSKIVTVEGATYTIYSLPLCHFWHWRWYFSNSSIFYFRRHWLSSQLQIYFIFISWISFDSLLPCLFRLKIYRWRVITFDVILYWYFFLFDGFFWGLCWYFYLLHRGQIYFSMSYWYFILY